MAIDTFNELKAKKARITVEQASIGAGQFSSNNPMSPPSVESSMPGQSFTNMPQNRDQMLPPSIPTNLSTGRGNIHNFFAARTKPGSQPSLEAIGWKKNVHSQARKAIANFWYYSDIPFHCARSPYWQAMVDAIAVAGPGFKAPTSESLRTDLLLESVDDVMLILVEFRSS